MIDRRTAVLTAVYGGAAALTLAACSNSTRQEPASSHPDRAETISPGSGTTPSTSPEPQSRAQTRPRAPGPLVGTGAWKTTHTTRELADSGARWYYTWSPDHAGIEPISGCEFVPMIEDRSQLTHEALKVAKANGDTLLGFNEPELRTHANMTVQQAIDAWPMLESTGMRLGAPAVAGDADVVDSYFYTFMRAAKAKGCRIDFVPVHWYLAPQLRDNFTIAGAVADLTRYLDRVYAQYQLPVWLTEFSLVTWYATSEYVQDPNRQADFIFAASEAMAPLSYLERWAWFSLNPTRYSAQTALYGSQGHVTTVGKKFRTLS